MHGIKKILTGTLVCAACVAISPVSLFADDMTGNAPDNTVQVGDDLTMQDSSHPGGVTGGSGSSNTNTSEENTTGGAQGEQSGQGGSSEYVPTEEDIAWGNVSNAAGQVNDAYQSILDKLKEQFQLGNIAYGGGSNSNLNLITSHFPSSSLMDELDDCVDRYNTAYRNFRNTVAENNQYVSEANAKELLDYDAYGNTGSGYPADPNLLVPGQLTNLDLSSVLTESELELLWQQMLSQLGLSLNTTPGNIMFEFPLSGDTWANSFVIDEDGKIHKGSSSSTIEHGSYLDGLREDLFNHGLYLPGSGMESMEILDSYRSNALWNWCNLISLRNYHVSNVSEVTYNIDSYEDDIRYWYVYYQGEELGYYTTYNDDHVFHYIPEWAGEYTIVCYRNAYYTTQKLVTVDQYDFLIDAAGGNILYYDQVQGAQQINVGSSELQGPDIIPTGDTWTYTVVEGDVPQTGNTTERVE